MSFGRTAYTPSIAPTVRNPAQSLMFNLPGATTTYTQAPQATSNAGTPQPQQPLGDWRTPLNLTSNWGKVDQPLSSWFINPTPYQQTLMSVQSATAASKPIYPTVKPIAPGPGLPDQTYNWSAPNLASLIVGGSPMPQMFSTTKAPTTSSSTRTK